MLTATETLLVELCASKLRQLTERIAVCLDKLTEEQVWARGSRSSNAIGNLVLHLCGNVRQWILHGVGGQADVRKRDDEFNAEGGATIADLKARLQATVAEAVEVIEALDSEEMLKAVKIQAYTVPKFHAVFHVVEHFSQHTGQIIFATKFLTGDELGFYTHLKNPAHGERTP